MEAGHPVPQQEDRRLSSPGRQKGHTRKSKINRNVCPCKLYDKEFRSFCLLTKISLIFRREIEHQTRDLLFTCATVCFLMFYFSKADPSFPSSLFLTSSSPIYKCH